MPDAHRGGSLSDMAVNGTSIPNDAGKQNVIPSVPRPDQKEGHPAFQQGGLGGADLASAAGEHPHSPSHSHSANLPPNKAPIDKSKDNQTDLPRNPKDIGASAETMTATGDQLPAQVESKRLHFGANDALAKGHDRRDKHARQNESDFERYQSEGAGVAAAPGEEDDGQDEIRDRMGL
ncbi:hypothetical protein BDV97DRAFT_394749 [Delphinella strobiligena]|nr:hypothetical protein BDV97DRAFT_394749 [Delphinella strobiligena]